MGCFNIAAMWTTTKGFSLQYLRMCLLKSQPRHQFLVHASWDCCELHIHSESSLRLFSSSIEPHDLAYLCASLSLLFFVALAGFRRVISVSVRPLGHNDTAHIDLLISVLLCPFYSPSLLTGGAPAGFWGVIQ